MRVVEALRQAEGRTIVALALIAAAFGLQPVQSDWARDMFVFGMALLAREMGVHDGKPNRTRYRN